MKYFRPIPQLRQLCSARHSAAGRIRGRQSSKLLLFGVLGLSTMGPSALGLQSRTSSRPKTPAPSYASVRSIRIVQANDGPAVEILSTKPLIPSITLLLKDPPRIVIDLPRARMELKQKRISVQANQISTLRADQFQDDPPVARVVVDLLAPRAYTWEAAGNRLLVHLGPNPPMEARHSPFQTPVVPSPTRAPQPVTAVAPVAGMVALVGEGTVSGSSVTAGAETAVLNLARGGQVHVCPGTTVSVTPAQNRRNLMLSMNTGALETHYSLDASSDSLLTPDFRILLTGPGEFHYAVSADTRGNTCVRALPGNTASAVVSELMGDRTYQVKATDQLLFHTGRLDQVDMAVPLECGCPPLNRSLLRAAGDLTVLKEGQPSVAQNLAVKPVVPEATPSSTTSSVAPAAPSAVPAPNSNELHVQVDAPLVFRATDPPPAPLLEARTLPIDSRRDAAPALTTPLPPAVPKEQKPARAEIAAANPPPHRGFFGKLRGFFAAMFR